MTTPSSPAALLDALAQRYWRFECRETPLFAALAGEPLADDMLFRESAADYQRRNDQAGEMLDELAAIDPVPLTAQQRATHRLLQRELEGIRAHHAVKAHLRPSLFPVGLDFSTVFWANSTAFSDVAGAQRYVDRLAGIPAALRDAQDNLASGHAQGMRYPRAVLAASAANTRGMLEGSAEASAWYGPFRRSPAAAVEGVRAQGERALAVIRDALRPALENYAAFIEGPLAEDTDDAMACTVGPHGRDFYQVLVKHFTTTDMTPDEIHALGLAEVGRIAAEIEQVAERAGFAGDVDGYRRFLTTAPEFVAPSKEALRESIESLCKRIDRHIPTYFGRIPRSTYGVDSVPEAMSARMPPAYAQPAPADGSAAGMYWVSGLPSKCPSYLHVAMSLHEAWPGHLMHIALMQEADDLPAFRRNGAVKYTACVEGWALYCETLGVEMGLYETPHQHYGRLEMEMWRAVRLVVDTGIHWHGWSREQSIDYMQQRLTLSEETVTGEVDRYAALPAQALAYQIGNLKLRDLRRQAEDALGEHFQHRRFHEAVMTAGAVTLPVLGDLVEDWLAQKLDALPTPTQSASQTA